MRDPDCPPAGASVGAAADAALADDWSALCAAEADAISRRREFVLGNAARTNRVEVALPVVGLALSGGGVRSATFALGLMRGLARPQVPVNPGAADPTDPAETTLSANGLLGRLDYLSTVSGGGYTGGMYGRLVATYGLACAQGLMARGTSPVLEWLRRNGRYLTPSGSRDIGMAVATYFRAWLAIHVEFMFFCILLGLLVVAPHLWNHSTDVLKPEGWESWVTPWWPIALAFWAALAPGLIAGYWVARDAPEAAARGHAAGLRDAIFLIAVATGALAWLLALLRSGQLDPARDGLSRPAVGLLMLTSLVLGQFAVKLWLARASKSHALKVALLRNWLTRALRLVFLGTLALAAMGALDRLSWWLMERLLTGNLWLWGGVGIGGVTVLVLRALMQPLQQIASQSMSHGRDWLPRLLDVGSAIGLLALVTAWLVALQWFVFAPDTFSVLNEVPPWLRASLLAALWLAWIVLSGGNAQMANTSSLHNFYRARLNRAYLAVGNADRNLDQSAGRFSDVTRVVAGDDTGLREYRPETKGGPIHLVNTTLNQTRDDKSGLYNADRKGAALTASWRGLEVGPHDFTAFKPGMDAGSLGRWIAVSGAAASPGAGSYTSRGLALLVYFLGVRLGQWMRAPSERVELRWLSRLGWRWLPKPLMLSSEASATFFGVDRPWWYLSDGGHFENSGVYPLLKREVGFIILSDAGSDANYEFNDLENLVRKARIDLGAEIDFYTHDEAEKLFTPANADLTVLSPEDLADNHSCRGVLLARIRYRERPGPPRADGSPGAPLRPEGTLLVVKPNLHDAIDVDLLGYARKHIAFPHEPTGDQSFDEAQWESYHRLGEDFGSALCESWLAQVPGWRSPARHAIRVAARLGSAQAIADKARSEPLWRRSAKAAAIGTTLGVGASGTLLLALWQVHDQFQRNQLEEQKKAQQLIAEVTKELDTFNGACPKVFPRVVEQTRELLARNEGRIFSKPEKSRVDLLAAVINQGCVESSAPSASCSPADRNNRDQLCLVKDSATNSADARSPIDYWRPVTGVEAQMQQARKLFDSASARFRKPPVNVAVTADPVQDDYSVAWTSAAPTAAPESAQYWQSSVPVSAPAPAPAVAPPLTATNPAVPAPIPGTRVAPSSGGVTGGGAATAAAAAGALDSCVRADGRSTVYIQIYDEASRAPASAFRYSLQAAGKSQLLVAPLENVVAGAELRQQSRPVAWPKPTFVLHDPASRDCARAMVSWIGAPWRSAESSRDSDGVWLRDLPKTLKARPGVIELWLPPIGTSVSQAGAKENDRAGGRTPLR